MKSTFALALTLTVGLAPVTASAFVLLPIIGNIHAGSICHSLTAAQAANFTFSAQGIKNTSTTTVPVICPLVRRTSTLNRLTAYVSVFVNSPTTTTISCTLSSSNSDGTLLDSAYGVTVTTGAGATPNQGISLVTASTYVTGNYANNYNVICNLPPQGMVYQVIGID